MPQLMLKAAKSQYQIPLPPKSAEYELKSYRQKDMAQRAAAQAEIDFQKKFHNLRQGLRYADQVEGDLTKLKPQQAALARGALMQYGPSLERLPKSGDWTYAKDFDNYLRYGRPTTTSKLPAPKPVFETKINPSAATTIDIQSKYLGRAPIKPATGLGKYASPAGNVVGSMILEKAGIFDMATKGSRSVNPNPPTGDARIDKLIKASQSATRGGSQSYARRTLSR